MIRGIRGAIQVDSNDVASILNGTEKLMRALIEANSIRAENVASVVFTVTSDLNAAFPAEVRKRIGWDFVPLLCAQEIPVPDSMPRVVRVLVMAETQLNQREIRHQYLGAAEALRKDLRS